MKDQSLLPVTQQGEVEHTDEDNNCLESLQTKPTTSNLVNLFNPPEEGKEVSRPRRQLLLNANDESEDAPHLSFQDNEQVGSQDPLASAGHGSSIFQHCRTATNTNLYELYNYIFDDEDESNENSTLSQRLNHDGGQTNSTGSATIILLGSVANLCSATLGAGILALPYAFLKSGLVVGIGILLTAIFFTVESIRILAVACEFYQVFSYEKLVDRMDTNGKVLRGLTQICMVVFCLGTAVAYIIAVGDILEMTGLLIEVNGQPHRISSMVVVWSVSMLPLSMVKKIQTLQLSSAIGIASIVTLVVAAFINLLEDLQYDHNHSSNSTNNTFTSMTNRREEQDEQSDTNHHTPQSMSLFLWPTNGIISVLTAFPIIIFAFSCQVNVCAIYQELPAIVTATEREQESDEETRVEENTTRIKNNKLLRMMSVTIMSVAVCAVLYTFISLVGIADFGYSVEPNILTSYQQPIIGVMEPAVVSMAITVIMAFPLNILPARSTFLECYRYRRQRYNIIAEDVGVGSSPLEDTLVEGVLEDDRNRNETDERREIKLEPPRSPQSPQANINIDTTNDNDLAAPLTPTAPCSQEQQSEDDDPFLLHVILTLVLSGSALGLACVFPDISVVFGLLGGSTASILGFCIPGCLGLQLCRDLERQTSENEVISTSALTSSRARLRKVSWILLVGGVVIGVVTTAVTLYSTFLSTMVIAG